MSRPNNAHLIVIGLLNGIGVCEVVDGDGQENVEQDVVAAHEEDDEVHAGDESDAIDPAKRLDSVVHDHVPIFTGKNLVH